jgi:hypothetical protein
VSAPAGRCGCDGRHIGHRVSCGACPGDAPERSVAGSALKTIAVAGRRATSDPAPERECATRSTRPATRHSGPSKTRSFPVSDSPAADTSSSGCHVGQQLLLTTASVWTLRPGSHPVRAASLPGSIGAVSGWLLPWPSERLPANRSQTPGTGGRQPGHRRTAAGNGRVVAAPGLVRRDLPTPIGCHSANASGRRRSPGRLRGTEPACRTSVFSQPPRQHDAHSRGRAGSSSRPAPTA